MILVVAEQRDGKLNRASWEAIAAAQQAGDQVKVVILGAGIEAWRRSWRRQRPPRSIVLDDRRAAGITPPTDSCRRLRR